MFDLIIEGAEVVDGSGGRPYRADIGIKGSEISEIGWLREAEAARRLDAEGRVVCPGFIDVHSHADLSYFKPDHDKLLAPLVRQGITTFVGGNCGMALAPISPQNREAQKMYLEVFTRMDFEKDIRWEGLGSFMEFLDGEGVMLNTALLAPHGMLRLAARGTRLGVADDREILTMKAMLDECMEAGAFGLSTGLQYFPGNQSETEELAELGKSLSGHDGVFSSHLRSYTSSTLARAIDEVASVARANDIRCQVSHIFSVPWFGPVHGTMIKALKKLAGYDRLSSTLLPDAVIFSEMKKILSTVNRHRDSGVRVGMDIMPTTAGFTSLLAFFPPWVLTGTRSDVMKRARSRETRREILRDIEEGSPAWPHRGRNDWSLNLIRQMGWDALTVMAVHSEENSCLEGMNFVQIGEQQGKHPFDAMCDLMLEEEGRVLVFESLSEPDDLFTEKYTFPALQDKDVSIVTDSILLGMGKPSYLFYGCYPKFINRYVYQKKLLDLPAAIARCTSLPARQMSIRRRGLVSEGFYADLLMLRPAEFRTDAVFRDPEHHPQGLDMVIINGTVVLEDGRLDLQSHPGMVLRRNAQPLPSG